MASTRKPTQSPTKEKQKQISRKASHPILQLSGSLCANSNSIHQSAFGSWLAAWPLWTTKSSAGFHRAGWWNDKCQYSHLTHLRGNSWTQHLSACRSFWHSKPANINLIVRLNSKKNQPWFVKLHDGSTHSIFHLLLFRINSNTTAHTSRE